MQITINIVFSSLLIVALFLMGLEIDMGIIWSVLKKPIGPAIGFVSQFVFMPLCAYGLAKALLLNGKEYTVRRLLLSWVYIKKVFIILSVGMILTFFSSRAAGIDITRIVPRWGCIELLDCNV